MSAPLVPHPPGGRTGTQTVLQPAPPNPQATHQQHAPAPPSGPAPSSRPPPSLTRQALAVLLRDTSSAGSHAPSEGAAGSTKSKHRTRQLLQQVERIGSLAELEEQQSSLRNLIIGNERRRREHWNLLRLQDIQFVEQRTLLRGQEEADRAALDRNADEVFSRDMRFHVVVCGEATNRNRLAKQYPPQELWDAHVVIAGTIIARAELRGRVDVVIATERFERDFVESRAAVEEAALLEMRAAVAAARSAQVADIDELLARKAARLTVERAELAERTRLESDALQAAALLVAEGFAAGRHASYWDVPTHETRARAEVVATYFDELERLRAHERRAMSYRQTLASRARIVDVEQLQRDEIATDEASAFQQLSIEALRAWQRIYDASMASRGPRVEVERSETFARRDIETAFFTSRSALSAREQEAFWAVRRRDLERSDFYDDFLNGRIALMRLERSEFDCHVATLRAAIAARQLEAIFARHERLESAARDDIEYERWGFFLAMHLRAALVRTECDADAARAATAAEEFQSRRALLRLLEHIVAAASGGPAARAETEAVEAGLREALDEEEAEAREVLRSALREVIDAEEEAVRESTASLSLDPSFANRSAAGPQSTSHSRLMVKESESRAAASLREQQRRGELALVELQDRERLARRALAFGSSALLRHPPPHDHGDHDFHNEEAVALHVDLSSERGSRALVYVLVLESAEALRRWELEWDARFDRWDVAELRVLDEEQCRRAEWLRAEGERRALVYDMRNQPLPKNVWLGSLEGDENQIRTNVEFEAEIAAGALLNYFRLVAPGYFDSVPRIVYRDLERNATPQFFKMEISLAERIGDAMLAMEMGDEPDARGVVVSEALLGFATLRIELREALMRTRLEAFEAELFSTTVAVFLRMRRRIDEQDVLALTRRTVDDEQSKRDATWLESRTGMLQLLETFEEAYREAERQIITRLLIAQGPLWDEHRLGAEAISSEELQEWRALHQREADARVDAEEQALYEARDAAASHRGRTKIVVLQLHSVRFVGEVPLNGTISNAVVEIHETVSGARRVVRMAPAGGSATKRQLLLPDTTPDVTSCSDASSPLPLPDGATAVGAEVGRYNVTVALKTLQIDQHGKSTRSANSPPSALSLIATSPHRRRPQPSVPPPRPPLRESALDLLMSVLADDGRAHSALTAIASSATGAAAAVATVVAPPATALELIAATTRSRRRAEHPLLSAIASLATESTILRRAFGELPPQRSPLTLLAELAAECRPVAPVDEEDEVTTTAPSLQMLVDAHAELREFEAALAASPPLATGDWSARAPRTGSDLGIRDCQLRGANGAVVATATFFIVDESPIA